MRAWFLLFLFLLSSGAGAALDTRKIHIGSRYYANDLPAGCQSEDGRLINDTLAIGKTVCDGVSLLVLERLLSRNAQGQVYWEVLDIVSLPPHRKGEWVDFGASCGLPNEPRLLAFASLSVKLKRQGHDVDVRSYRVKQALRIDLKEARFEPVDPKNVTCGFELP